MPIVGPLREFGVHDVFQLLALSRKTGMLRVASATGGEGFVVFDAGRVAHAGMRGQPSAIEDVLVASGRIGAIDVSHARTLSERNPETTVLEVLIQAGAIAERDVERVVRHQVESVVFELMTWREGQFVFEERQVADLPRTGMLFGTESLVMESARRLDEWSNIASRVPNASAVPAIATGAADHETRIDLHPHEWLVLGLIDGERDVRALAAATGHAVFEVAKVIYGLAMTGLVEVHVAGAIA